MRNLHKVPHKIRELVEITRQKFRVRFIAARVAAHAAVIPPLRRSVSRSAGKADVSKETLEQRKHIIIEKSRDSFNKTVNLKVLRWSLIENYESNHLGIDLKFSIDNLEWPKPCVSICRGRVEHSEGLPINDLQIRRGQGSTKTSEKDSPVLIDVGKFVQNVDERRFCVGPNVIRLKLLDNGSGLRRDSIQQASGELTPVILGSDGDWKGVLFTEIIPVSPHKFPYQVIETGPEVTETISQDMREMLWNSLRHLKGSVDPLTPILIRGHLWLSHEVAGVNLHVLTKFPLKKLEVVARPIEF